MREGRNRDTFWDMKHKTVMRETLSVFGPEFNLYRRDLQDDLIMQEYLNNPEDICLMYFGFVSYRQEKWLIF